MLTYDQYNNVIRFGGSAVSANITAADGVRARVSLPRRLSHR
jgi:hypothetical protein